MSATKIETSLSYEDQLARAKAKMDGKTQAREKRKGPEAGQEAQDPVAAKAAAKAAREKAAALTKMLVGLAEIGEFDAIVRAVEAGASVMKACDRGMTPLMAALENGHRPTALWLFEKGSNLRQRDWNYRNAATACLKKDDLEMLQKIAEADPVLLHERSGRWNGDEGFPSALVQALSIRTAPRCARWLYENRKSLGLKDPTPSQMLADALIGALAARDWENALWHRKLIGNLWSVKRVKDPASRPSWRDRFQAPDMAVLEALFQADDAKGLLFMLENCPELASRGSQPLEDAGYVGIMRLKNDKRSQDIYSFSNRFGEKLKVPTMFMAAALGAWDCLDVLGEIEGFAGEVARSQKEPKKYLWEEGFSCARHPESYEALKAAGFDFSAKMGAGYNYLHVLLGSMDANQRIMERIGRDLSSLADETDDLGTTALERALSERRYGEGKLRKWMSALENRAMKVGMVRASRKKGVAKSGGPRL